MQSAARTAAPAPGHFRERQSVGRRRQRERREGLQRRDCARNAIALALELADDGSDVHLRPPFRAGGSGLRVSTAAAFAAASTRTAAAFSSSLSSVFALACAQATSATSDTRAASLAGIPFAPP